MKNWKNDDNCHRRRQRNGAIPNFHFEGPNLGHSFRFGTEPNSHRRHELCKRKFEPVFTAEACSPATFDRFFHN